MGDKEEGDKERFYSCPLCEDKEYIHISSLQVTLNSFLFSVCFHKNPQGDISCSSRQLPSIMCCFQNHTVRCAWLVAKVLGHSKEKRRQPRYWAWNNTVDFTDLGYRKIQLNWGSDLTRLHAASLQTKASTTPSNKGYIGWSKGEGEAWL